MLNIENISILSEEEEGKVDKRIKETTLEEEQDDEIRHYQYNYPYYTYMMEGDRIYDSLYLNYNKTKNIGDINL